MVADGENWGNVRGDPLEAGTLPCCTCYLSGVLPDNCREMTPCLEVARAGLTIEAGECSYFIVIHALDHLSDFASGRSSGNVLPVSSVILLLIGFTGGRVSGHLAVREWRFIRVMFIVTGFGNF